MKTALIVLMLSLVATPVFATTYYIAPSGNNSTGSGTSLSPWASTEYAIGNMTVGDVLMVKDGTYVPQSCTGVIFTGAGITIEAENSYKAVFQSTAASHRVFSVYACQGISIQGIRFQATTSAPTSGATEYLVHVSNGSGSGAQNIEFKNCIFGDSYYQDTIKVNGTGTNHIYFRNCIYFNNNPGVNIFDINTVTDVDIEDSIFFQDYAGSSRSTAEIGTGSGAKGMILIKNSGSTQTSQTFHIRRNVFFSYQGASDYGFIQLGEDDNAFYEVTDCTIENNLFISDQSSRILGVLGIKDCRQITYRANTQVGNMNVGTFGVAGYFAKQTGTYTNPGCDDLRFFNNIWADNTGNMVKFSAGDPADTTNLQTDHNVYWNNGNAIPNNARVLEASMDSNAILTDPKLPNVPSSIQYPRWNNSTNQFLSGNTTIRQEFERLVNAYAPLGSGSSAIDAANASNMPSDDILGNARGANPDCGCFEFGSSNQAPVADAQVSGTLQVGNTVTLDGSASYDPDTQPNASLSYSWTQTAGPSVSLSGASTDTATFSAATVGSYTFELTVDDGGATDVDTVSFNITDPAITLDTSTWTMQLSTGTQPGSDTRTLTYNGSGTLAVGVSSNQSWLAVGFDNGSAGNTLAGGNSGTITATVADVSALSDGQHTATISISANDGTTHDQQITFVLTVFTPGSFSSGGGSGGGGGCASGQDNSWPAVLILTALLAGAAIATRLRCGRRNS